MNDPIVIRGRYPIHRRPDGTMLCPMDGQPCECGSISKDLSEAFAFGCDRILLGIDSPSRATH